MMAYAEESYYREKFSNAIPEEELAGNLEKASRQIDTLTFCRIRGIGFDNLTNFQKEQIRYVNCLLADFLYENADELNTMLSSYSINGVSMSFSSSENISKVQGLLIRNDIYEELKKTGLCDRRFV